MPLLFKITAGWTKEIGPFTLRNRGLPISIPAGAVLTLKIKTTTSRNFVDTAGDVRVATDQSEGSTEKGQVFFTPDEDDFTATGPKPTIYQLKWELVDAGGRTFFPNGEPDTMEVYPV